MNDFIMCLNCGNKIVDDIPSWEDTESKETKKLIFCTKCGSAIYIDKNRFDDIKNQLIFKVGD